MTLTAVALQATSMTAQARPPTLQPYVAQYQTSARGFDLKITRKLEENEKGQFILTNGGKILVVGFHEISVFRLEGGRVMPLSYVYQGTGMITRRREIHFASDPGRISSLYKDNWYDLPYSQATLDRMSQLEQLRLVLLSDPEPARDITLRVADGKRVKDSRLMLIGEETLSTPLGAVETLHYERLHESADRKSHLWFAPQWDYLMVKTIHIEDGDPVEMMISAATIGGRQLGAD